MDIQVVGLSTAGETNTAIIVSVCNFPLLYDNNSISAFHAGYEPHLTVFVVASPPGFLLGRTRCARRYGRAFLLELKRQSRWNISYFIVSADLDEEYFTLEEIKEKIEDQRLGWRSKFKGGLEKIEVEHIEQSLKSRAAKEEVRYDFTFYTPTCRYVRIKVSFFVASYLLTEEK